MVTSFWKKHGVHRSLHCSQVEVVHSIYFTRRYQYVDRRVNDQLLAKVGR